MRQLWSATIMPGVFWGLGAAGMLIGLGEAVFSEHVRGLFWMIGGALIFDAGVRAWNRQRDKDTDE